MSLVCLSGLGVCLGLTRAIASADALSGCTGRVACPGPLPSMGA